MILSSFHSASIALCQLQSACRNIHFLKLKASAILFLFLHIHKDKIKPKDMCIMIAFIALLEQ